MIKHELTFYFSGMKITLPENADLKINNEIKIRINELKTKDKSYVHLMSYLLNNNVPVKAEAINSKKEIIEAVNHFNATYKKLGLLYTG